jgi:diguanylate cyclase (GGDEF)-like protein
MRSLRLKILALAVLLVVLTQLGTIGTVLFTASREVHETARRNLLTAGGVLDRVMQLRSDQLHGTMRLLVTDPEFSAAMLSGNRAAVDAALARAGQRVGAGLAVIFDGRSRILAGSAGAAGLPVEWPAASILASKTAPALSALRVGNGVFEIVTIPIRRGEGAPREWLSMGLALDQERTLRINQLTGLQAMFLANGTTEPRVVASSLPLGDAWPVELTLARQKVGPDAVFRMTIEDEEYLGVRRPFVPDSPEVSVLLLESLEKASAPYRVFRSWGIVLGIVALLAALAGAAVVARAITRPIGQLARAAARIRNGDYSESVEIGADDELGTLATAFNTMQSGIAEREHRITYQAQFDALTGLPNRLLALSRLDQALQRAAASGEPVSLLVVDLGSFGNIAAALGHEIGDALLAQAAERLRASVDARHTVARLEADEFAIVLDGMGLDPARELAEDLLRLLSVGLSVRDVNVSLNAVIGMASYPQHAREPEQLLLRATVAKDDARSAQQSIHVYQDGREERRVRQLAVLGDLRRAVRHDEIKLYLQPKISLASGRVCGAEALVRWDHPTYGWLPPGEFIGIAEQFGNITLITRWALSAAVRECRLWVEEGLDLSVSVNLSSRDLLDQNLPLFVLELLRDHDLDPRYLTLEVTEEALVRDFSRATLVLQCLRDLGVRISIDDFGTGYSSLSQIKNLPVDEIKIDRAFVMELPENRADAAIVRAAVDLAHDLGLEVVAEGVEKEPAMRWLAERGCEGAQGFLISRPMPAEAFGEWVARHDSALAGGWTQALAIGAA